jgi:DNA primase
METHDILEKYGVRNIVSHGKNWMASCPWHKDKTPSFGMNKDSGAWQCFSCKAAGPHLISFVAKMEKCSDRDAAKKIYGGEESEIRYHRMLKWVKTKLGTKTIEPKETPYIPGNLNLIPWNKSSVARKWLQENRIAKKTAEKFHIQYSESGFYEGYLGIPIWDTQGRIWTYEFRRVSGEGKKVLYLPEAKMSSVVYNLDSISKDWCFIVEGCKDTWAVWEHDVPVVSCFGTHIGMKQIRLLLSKGIDTVVLFFDGDKAGQEAIWGSKGSKTKGILHKLQEWFTVNVANCPEGMDPHDLSWNTLQDIIEGTVDAMEGTKTFHNIQKQLSSLV